MRTKTLLLSALLGTLGSVSLLAQSTNVYSLNAVGYINVTCPASGFSMIACQLITTNNTVGSLMNNYLASGNPGPYEGCQVYKWTGSTYLLDTGDNELSGEPTGWDNNGVITMNPGEAIWFYNPNSTNIVITFVGTVPQGSLTNSIGSPGFTMLSSIVPQGGDLVTNLGLTNYNDGDQVYVWNNPPGTYVTSTVDLELGYEGYLDQWDSPDPVVAVGQGFWYYTTGGAISWVRSFSVNN